MQLTIFSVKLDSQTDEQFEHEFRTVHANETKGIASTLGLISRYTQGVALKGDQLGETAILPNSKRHQPISVAQLTWPSPTVLGASLHTQGYRDTAGKHVFANSDHIFMTERIEPHIPLESSLDTSLSKAGSPVFLAMVLIPAKTMTDDEFRQAWDRHAATFRDKVPSYQRDLAIPLTQPEVNTILHDTAFTPELCELHGGIEELYFPSLSAAQNFLKLHATELQASYKTFTGDESYLSAFDYAVPWSENDRGVKQAIVGTVVGNALWLKTALGI